LASSVKGVTINAIMFKSGQGEKREHGQILERGAVNKTREH
jgi:hypothetical protein